MILMRRQSGFAAMLVGAAALLCAAGPAAEAAQAAGTTAERDAAIRDYATLPLGFVPNAGQSDARVRYLAQGGGFGFFFTERGVMLSFSKPPASEDENPLVVSSVFDDVFAGAGSGGRAVALELGFVDANPDARLVASERATGKVSYLGPGRAAGQAGLATYRELTYKGLWPGIDMAFRGEGGQLKYEFHVAAGADPSDIALVYRGAERLALAAGGDAVDHDRTRNAD